MHPHALHYRCIDTDYGGTYKHHRRRDSDKNCTADTLPAIGTYGCSSCVGIYMELSPTTCFVAHINALHRPLDYSNITRDDMLYDLRVVTEVEDGFVRDELIRKLNLASRCMHWPPAGQIRNVVLVCPVMEHPISGAKLSGTHVVQAIREFLGWRDLPVNTQSEGFVVRHDTGVLHYFPCGDGVQYPPLPDNGRGYVVYTCHGDEWPRCFIDIGKVVAVGWR